MNTTQQRLLETGLDIVRQRGLRGLTVRGLAHQAGVNPGSFVYHFGTRDRFVDALIERWYAPLFERLQLSAREGSAATVRLGALITQLLDILLEHGQFVGQLFMDAAAGEAGVRRFIATLGDRHIRLLLHVVTEAQQAGEIEADEPVHVLMFIMAAVGLPALLHFGWTERHPLPSEIDDALTRLAADRTHIQRRLRWALAGLANRGKSPCNDAP